MFKQTALVLSVFTISAVFFTPLAHASAPSSYFPSSSWITELKQRLMLRQRQSFIWPIPIPTPYSTQTIAPTPTPLTTVHNRVSPSPTQIISPTVEASTLTPTLNPSVTKMPTIIQTPTPSSVITAPSSPTSVEQNKVQEYLMDRVNEYRKSLGLLTVSMNDHTCAFAQVRAKEISTSFNHDGFRDRIQTKTLPYPEYSYITENIAMTSDYKNVVAMWIHSSGHAANMRADTPYVCIAQYENYYAYEGWRP